MKSISNVSLICIIVALYIIKLAEFLNIAYSTYEFGTPKNMNAKDTKLLRHQYFFRDNVFSQSQTNLSF